MTYYAISGILHSAGSIVRKPSSGSAAVGATYDRFPKRSGRAWSPSSDVSRRPERITQIEGRGMSGKTGRHKRDRVVRGTGNVFRDLGVISPEEALAKAELVSKIAEVIAVRGLTQAAAAGILGIDQPKVSALVRGRLSGFSTDRLLRFLTALGQDVDIVIRSRRGKSGRQGRIHVCSA